MTKKPARGKGWIGGTLANTSAGACAEEAPAPPDAEGAGELAAVLPGAAAVPGCNRVTEGGRRSTVYGPVKGTACVVGGVVGSRTGPDTGAVAIRGGRVDGASARAGACRPSAASRAAHP